MKSKQRTNASKIIEEKLSPSVLWDVFTFPLSFSNTISYAQMYEPLVSPKINCEKQCSMTGRKLQKYRKVEYRKATESSLHDNTLWCQHILQRTYI